MGYVRFLVGLSWLAPYLIPLEKLYSIVCRNVCIGRIPSILDTVQGHLQLREYDVHSRYYCRDSIDVPPFPVIT